MENETQLSLYESSGRSHQKLNAGRKESEFTTTIFHFIEKDVFEFQWLNDLLKIKKC